MVTIEIREGRMIAEGTMELTAHEKTRMEELEAVIKDGLMTFMDVGASLLEIRNSRLYRQEYGTFEQYCRAKWSMDKRYANRLIDAHAIVMNLGPIGPTSTRPGAANGALGPQIPTSEGQVRPLAKLEPEKHGKEKSLALGTYPMTSIEDARRSREAAKELLSQGFDPSEIRKQEKALSKADRIEGKRLPHVRIGFDGRIEIWKGGNVLHLTWDESRFIASMLSNITR